MFDIFLLGCSILYWLPACESDRNQCKLLHLNNLLEDAEQFLEDRQVSSENIISILRQRLIDNSRRMKENLGNPLVGQHETFPLFFPFESFGTWNQTQKQHKRVGLWCCFIKFNKSGLLLKKVFKLSWLKLDVGAWAAKGVSKECDCNLSLNGAPKKHFHFGKKLFVLKVTPFYVLVNNNRKELQ